MQKFLFRFVLAAFLVAAPASAALPAASRAAQHESASESGMTAPKFAPLDLWRTTVLYGDLDNLKALYSTVPPAETVIGRSDSHDPAIEPQFWAATKSAGLAALKIKIGGVDSPQPGVQRVMFSLEADMSATSGKPKSFAAIAQYWLQQDGYWRIVATQRTPFERLPQPVALLLPEPTGDNPGPYPIYPSPAEAKPDIAAALAAAARDHKRVLLDFGGNWCSDCHVLDATFHYPEIARILGPSYVVVHVNIGEYDQNLDLAEKYQIPLKKGVPSLAILDAEGRLLVSQKNGDFENTTRIGLKDVEDFLQHWKPAE